MLSEVAIGLASWIIQDGNYGDFSVGETHKFVLEFFAENVLPSSTKHVVMHHLGHENYRVCGEVIFTHPTMWVIDVGVKALMEAKPPAFVSVGSWIEADIFLGIDPFSYNEYLHKLPDVPNLYYRWEILRIARNDTPWIETLNEYGGKDFARDSSQERWLEVPATDAWNDDNGKADYVLYCERS